MTLTPVNAQTQERVPKPNTEEEIRQQGLEIMRLRKESGKDSKYTNQTVRIYQKNKINSKRT